VSEWTVETLKAHMEALRALDRRLTDEQHASTSAKLESAMASAKEAVLKAEAATEKRLEGLNELRGAWTDNQRTLYPRAEAELALSALSEKVDLLTSDAEARRGNATGLSAGWAAAVAVVGLIALVVGLFLALKK
jgi:hypothetical protein